MKRANLIATACFTAVVGAIGLTSVQAQDSGAAAIEKSILTFSAPVELPNLTLQPGTYVFKRPDANSARIIQVYTQDEKDILGSFLTVPTRRLEVTNDNVVTFKEAREGATPAVHFWYYPNRETGHEFVYPKEQAMKIAARTGETVLSTEGEISADSTVTPIHGNAGADPSADTQASDAAANLPAAPNPDEQRSADASQDAQADAAHAEAGVDVNVNRQSSASTAESQVAANRQDQDNAGSSGTADMEAVGTSGQADADAQASNRLPATASPLALSALLGLLSLGGAASLRRFQR